MQHEGYGVREMLRELMGLMGSRAFVSRESGLPLDRRSPVETG